MRVKIAEATPGSSHRVVSVSLDVTASQSVTLTATATRPGDTTTPATTADLSRHSPTTRMARADSGTPCGASRSNLPSSTQHHDEVCAGGLNASKSVDGGSELNGRFSASHGAAEAVARIHACIAEAAKGVTAQARERPSRVTLLLEGTQVRVRLIVSVTTEVHISMLWFPVCS